jgi:hypothetical protein
VIDFGSLYLRELYYREPFFVNKDIHHEIIIFNTVYSDVADKEPLRFFPVNAERTDAEDGLVTVWFRAEVSLGRWPLGHLVTELEGYR